MAVVLSGADVRRFLTTAQCQDAMREVLSANARGELVNPLRTAMRPPGESTLLGLMPCFRTGAAPMYGVKATVVAPDNPVLGLDSHQGVVVLFDGRTGQTVAVCDASAITQLRTAAVTAVATDVLARAEATALAVIGSGVQARQHVEALAAVRPIARVDAFSPNSERLREFVSWVRETTGIPATAHASARAAVEAADIVVTATTAKQPVVCLRWVPEGAHVNAIGASVPPYRELDGCALAEARFVVDSRESARNEALDLITPLAEGLLPRGYEPVELGEILVRAAPGRAADTQRTVFKSSGMALQDLAAAARAVELATAEGHGTTVQL